nr:CONSTANS-like protein 1 [Ipomoea batatas]GMD39139.1 CONSTANS-like protein 1 [Ipomoea batatas]
MDGGDSCKKNERQKYKLLPKLCDLEFFGDGGGDDLELSSDEGEDKSTRPTSSHCTKVDATALCEQAPASFTCKVDAATVYEQAPASFTCKVAAATLCVTCDRGYHFANPLAHRHEHLPVVPFYDSAADAKSHGSAI